MDKFVLAENPMRPNSKQAFIVQMLNPISIFRAEVGHREKTGTFFKHYSFTNSDRVLEEWTLSVHLFYTSDFISEPQDQVMPVMDKAWRWYRSYLEWEDKNIDTDEYASNN